MGRYVRSVLRTLASRGDIALTLLVRDIHQQTDLQTIVERVELAALRAARTRARFDAVWYPWNGIRFASDAPSVVSINDDFAFSYPARGSIARLREQRPIRRAVRTARHILTISDWSRRMLSARFAIGAQRISVVPLGPDAQFTAGTDESPFHEPFVLAVGTSEDRKNIAFLSAVFERAFPAGDVRLVLVGTLDARLRRRKQAKFPLSELDAVDDAYLRRLYRTAAVVAVPSLAEGFGLVVAEAQACGAPVIASDTSALPEAVGSAGMLLAPTDASAWTRALRTLVFDRSIRHAYVERSLNRWPAGSSQRTADAVLLALQRSIDDRA